MKDRGELGERSFADQWNCRKAIVFHTDEELFICLYIALFNMLYGFAIGIAFVCCDCERDECYSRFREEDLKLREW